jgi:dihydropteroate synthase
MPTLLKINDQLVDFRQAKVMGIINITPDSFYSGGRAFSDKSIVAQVSACVEQGAAMLDVGAYSSRPGAEHVVAEEEMRRLDKALHLIRNKYPDLILSVDTFRSDVARHVVRDYGVQIINDISGGSLDATMFETIADLGVCYVLMHMRGTPQDMQNQTNYDDLMSELLHYFQKKLAQLRILGVNDVIVDPGFGFAKSLEQNYELLAKMHYLTELNMPLLAGVSRKSMLYKLLETKPEEALNATTAAHMLALVQGARVLRVHDVKPAIETIKIFNQYNQYK